MRKALSQEELFGIKEKYEKGIPVSQIAQDYGIVEATVTAAAKRLGVPLRHPRGGVIKSKICDYCKTKIVIPSAKYCWSCGRILLSKKEKQIQKAKGLFSYSSILPQESRDEFQALVKEVISYLEDSDE